MLFGCTETTTLYEDHAMIRFFAALCLCGTLTSVVSAQDTPKNTVDVTFDNVTLPIFLKWQQIGGKLNGEIPVNEKDPTGVAGKLPAVEMVVQVRAKSGDAWVTPAQYRVGNNGKPSEYTVFMHTLVLKEGEPLKIKCGNPLAPANSAIVMYENYPMLIGMARPIADYEIEKWEDGTGGREEFNSSPMFLAKYGKEKMASKIAAHFLRTGEYRIDHWSVVPSVFHKNLKQDVLEKQVERGIDAVLLKWLPRDGSNRKQLDAAKALLKEGRPKKKDL